MASRIAEVFISMDVEAAATGRGHNDRAPCWVAIVDQHERVIYDKIIKVPNIVSALTEITGLTSLDISTKGQPLASVLREIYALLGPHVVIVGQRPQGDIEWLQLQEGVHYKRFVNIAESFKMWNPRYSNWTYFSLGKTAYGLLGINMHQKGSGSHHDPVQDAKISIRLYNKFIAAGPTSHQLQKARTKLSSMTLRRAFPASLMAKNRNAPIDGVCSGKFSPENCICGQPIVR